MRRRILDIVSANRNTIVFTIHPNIHSLDIQPVGARRRATNAWLAEETHFLKITPPVTVLKLVCFTHPLLKIKRKSICILYKMKWLMI